MGGAKAGASTMAKFFPVEAYPVAAPVAVVAGLFTYMFTRTVMSDPDTKNRPTMPLDCKKSQEYGEQWRTSIRGFFDSRIKAGSTSVFNNPIAMQRS